MTSAPPARAFEMRHLQLARAAFAAIAALMVTFSPDHSAVLGLAVFSGFAIATGLVLLLAAWLVFPPGGRWLGVALGAPTLIAGMIGGIGPWRSTATFFAVVISWALVTGLVEALAAWRARKTGPVRDGVVIGVLTLVLGIALLLTPMQYALDYYIEDAGRAFTLTGITIGVGLFGGYAAIVAVYLAIAGFTPQRDSTPVRQTLDGGTA